MWSTTCWPHLLPISFPSSNFRPVKQYRAKNTRIRGQRESVLPIVLALLWNNLVWKIIFIALQVRPWVLRYPPRKATSLMQLTVPVWCWLMMTLACLKYCRFSVIPIFIPSSCSLDISMSIDSQTLHYSNILTLLISAWSNDWQLDVMNKHANLSALLLSRTPALPCTNINVTREILALCLQSSPEQKHACLDSSNDVHRE